MSKPLTSSDIINKVMNLCDKNPVYLWGGNGVPITPDVINTIKERFVSTNHTPAYYDDILVEYRGRIGMDYTGLLNYISGENLTTAQYLTKAVRTVDATDLNPTHVWFLSKTLSFGVVKIAVYLGNSQIMSLVDGYGMLKTSFIPGNWDKAFIPHFMDTTNLPLRFVSATVEKYQQWLNNVAGDRELGSVPISGYYDEQTKTLSRIVAKILYGEVYGVHMNTTPQIYRTEVIAEIGHRQNNNIWKDQNRDAYMKLHCILGMRLHSLGLFPGYTNLYCKDGDPDNFGILKDSAVAIGMVQQALGRFVSTSRYLDDASSTNLAVIRELFIDE